MKKKKILIVEDEFVVANDLEIMLQSADYETTGLMASVEDALTSISMNLPDIVLLDIHLQGTSNGIDLAVHLKAMNIPFVYLSANSDQTTLEKAKATEPYGFLVKPVRQKDLLITLNIACYKHEHSLESFLYKKEQLQYALTNLPVEKKEEVYIALQMAPALQMAIPFDFFCIAFSSEEGKQFRGLYRIGFNEYQFMDNHGLLNTAGKNIQQLDALLTSLSSELSKNFYNEKNYDTFINEDPLAMLLQRNHPFQSAIRINFQSSDSSIVNIYFFSKNPGNYSNKQLMILQETQNLIAGLFMDAGNSSGAVFSSAKAAENLIWDRFVGKSQSFLHCLDLVAQVAPLNTSVLLTGESGTGKELFAETIHQLSGRRDQPFIKINCAALPHSLIESELFGYEKGSFTGAQTSRTGKFEAASGGTIFLDEIGEMSPDVQAKLLRVLQDKKIQRIGSHKLIEADIRIIAATNRNLDKAVAEHQFRLDLYFRLNVFPIQLPPLRNRKDDIPLLATHIATRICLSMNKGFYGISNEMMQTLQQYHWPGNVRELENVIEHSVILSQKEQPLRLQQQLGNNEHTGIAFSSSGQFLTIDEIKRQQEFYEKEAIIAALREAHGKIRGADGAAEKLNMKPTTLESRLIRLGIRKEDFL